MTPISSEELREKLTYAAEWSEPDIDIASSDLLRQAAAYISTASQRIAELEAENEQLRLSICGGEDAPGYAASLPLETILRVLRDNYTQWRDAQSEASRWKAEAEGARRPITMQDVRLAVGEGPLTPADVLNGCNAELRRRAFLSQHSEGSAPKPDFER